MKAWLARRPHWHVHFTPTSASWLNQVERWFAELTRKQIQRAVKAANAVRGDKDLHVDLSVRATDEVCTLLGHPNFSEFDGDPLPELLQTSFCGRYLGRWDDPATDAGLVWQCIVRALKL